MILPSSSPPRLEALDETVDHLADRHRRDRLHAIAILLAIAAAAAGGYLVGRHGAGALPRGMVDPEPEAEPAADAPAPPEPTPQRESPR